MEVTEFGAAANSPEKEEAKGEAQEWQQSEIESLTTLRKRFKNKYKRTCRVLEEAQSPEEARSITNNLYLGFMQRVMKAAGVGRGAVLLERLQERISQLESSKDSQVSEEKQELKEVK